MALGSRADPYLTCNFLVEIEGLVVGGFSEVTGLQTEVEIQEYREGGENDYVHRLAGPRRYPTNLVLRRGLTTDDTLWRWHQEVKWGRVRRRNGSIVLLDSAGEERWRWNFVGAYPIRWTGPDLRAGTTEVAVESVELVHQGLVRAD
jgi:phage tail-like protein